MNKTKKTVFFLLWALTLLAQKENDNWYFGYMTGLGFNAPNPTKSAMNVEYACASVSDSLGNILFYTNGKTIWNRKNEIMDNGVGLAGANTTQGVIIVPQPRTSNIYYVFTTDAAAGNQGLNYTIVDISLNQGLGKVTDKNKSLFSPTTERLTSTNSADGKSVWIVSHDYYKNRFRAYKLTSKGLEKNKPVLSEVGSSITNEVDNRDATGFMKISPNGHLLAYTFGLEHKVELFDFDNCTGRVSNPITIMTEEKTSPSGIEFSSDSKKLYMVAIYLYHSKILQFDLTTLKEAAIITSKEVISQFDDFSFSMQLGPDNKIYISSPVVKRDLCVINNPNEKGSNCNFELNAIKIGIGYAKHGLPQKIITKHTWQKEITTSKNADSITINNIACHQEPVSLQFSGLDDSDNVYDWNFGDDKSNNANSASSKEVQHIFSDSGAYTVKLIVTNTCYGKDTLIRKLKVPFCINCNPYIPNAFSPNMDANNDEFIVYGLCDDATDFTMDIYSRWGEHLFHSTDIKTNGWDGRYRGSPIDEGVYVYLITYSIQGKILKKTGTITILR